MPDKLLIVGGGLSLRWDVVKHWEGDIVAVDAYAFACPMLTKRIPKYIVTLEDGPNMESFFKWTVEGEKPKVVISSRTQRYLIEYIKSQGLEMTTFDHLLVQTTYNVGMMAWFYAWEVLGYREIYLTGFDHLMNTADSPKERWWREAFYELKNYFAPPDLHTYLIGSAKFDIPNKKVIQFKDLQEYYNYRTARDRQFMTHWKGEAPEPLYEKLLE